MKTKLVIISETLKEGVGKHVADLILNLDKTKFEIHVIHTAKRIDAKFIKVKDMLKEEVNFYEISDFVREINIIKDIKAYYKIKNIVKGIDPDIVHCHSSKAGVIGRLVAKSSHIRKCYYTPHAYAAQNNMLSNKKVNLYKTIERIFAKYFTTKTINVSKGEKSFAMDNKIANDKDLIVIYNSINSKYDITISEDVIKKELGIKQEDIIIGYVARIFEQKNPFEFLNIANRVINNNSNVKFVWVGEGEQKDSVKKYINQNRLENKILLLGFKQNIDDYLNVFDIYLSTALYEGLPYTLIEAIRSKLPLVVSDVTGNNEVAYNEINGYLYKLQDIDDAVSKLELLINNEQLRKELGDQGYELFLKDFTIDKLIKAHEELYLS